MRGADEAESRFWGCARWLRVGVSAALLAVAAAAVLSLSAAAQGTATPIAAVDCNTTAEVDALTHPGAPTGFRLWRHGDGTGSAAGRGFGWSFDPRVANSASPVDAGNPGTSDVCNNVASYEVWYSTTEANLSSLTSVQLAAADPPATVTEIERNMPILMDTWSSWGNAQGNIGVGTYYAMLRVNFQRICGIATTTDDSRTNYINEATDMVPAGTETGNSDACDGVRGAWSSIKSITLPTPNPTVANEIPDQSVSLGGTLDYSFPSDTFSNANRRYKAVAVASDSLAAAKIDMPDWVTAYPGLQEDRYGAIGQARLRRFTGRPGGTENLGDLYVKVTGIDPYHGSVSDVFKITVRNRPPVFNPIGLQTATAGRGFSLRVSASDPDWHSLTFALTQNPGGWLRLINDQRRSALLQGSPGRSGTGSVTIEVTDEYGLTDSETFRIEVTNSTPTVQNEIPDWEPTVGYPASYTIRADTFNDADEHLLTWEATTKPSWLHVETRLDGGRNAVRLKGTPPNVNPETVVLTVTDEVGASVSDTFEIRPANSAPTIITGIPDKSATADTELSFEVLASNYSDADRHPLTLALKAGGPAWLSGTKTNSGIRLSGTPTTGTASMSESATVTVSDPYGGSVEDTFTITVGGL